MPFSYEMSPATGLILIGDDEVWEFHRQWNGKVALTDTVAQWSKKSCDIGQPVTLYRYMIDDAPRRVARQESLPMDAPAPSSVKPVKPIQPKAATPVAAPLKPAKADSVKRTDVAIKKDSAAVPAVPIEKKVSQSATESKQAKPDASQMPVTEIPDSPTSIQSENNNPKTHISQ